MAEDLADNTSAIEIWRGHHGSAAGLCDDVLRGAATGRLFCDADADGSGAGVRVLVATLTTLSALTSADIFVT